MARPLPVLTLAGLVSGVLAVMSTPEPGRINVKNAGLEDFGGEEDPTNQLKREGFVRNRDHIHEHLKSSATFDLDTATPEELDFHFFTIHDSNEDRALDGLELLAAIAHGLEEQFVEVEENEQLDEEGKKRRKRTLNNRSWMDRILREDDKNKDGYLSYAEFAESRRASIVLKEGINAQTKQQK